MRPTLPTLGLIFSAAILVTSSTSAQPPQGEDTTLGDNSIVLLAGQKATRRQTAGPKSATLGTPIGILSR